MTSKEAVNWIINLSADIGKSEHSELWHYEQALCEIREILESAQQWVPVTEQLPKESGVYLVTNVIAQWGEKSKSYITIADYYPREKYKWVLEYGRTNSVTAWMPLPKPFEGAD